VHKVDLLAEKAGDEFGQRRPEGVDVTQEEGRRAAKSMREAPASRGFGKIRPKLLTQHSRQLVRLIGDLYRLSKENQRFLEARLGDASKELPIYRRLVADCLFPDPLRRGSEVRISEAKRAVSQYERASGDAAGTVDLMLLFVETGTAFAADLGYGEDGFFSALQNMLSRVLNLLRRANEELRQSMRPRLIRLSASARGLGWGYGDFVADAIATFINVHVETGE
jgi:hypothetical protein